MKDTLFKLGVSVLATVGLSGALAAGGGWCAISTNAALGNNWLMQGFAWRLFCTLFAIFTGGIAIGAIAAYGFALRAIWKTGE